MFLTLYVYIADSRIQVFPENKHKGTMLKTGLAFMGRLLQNLSEIDGLYD